MSSILNIETTKGYIKFRKKMQQKLPNKMFRIMWLYVPEVLYLIDSIIYQYTSNGPCAHAEEHCIKEMKNNEGTLLWAIVQFKVDRIVLEFPKLEWTLFRDKVLTPHVVEKAENFMMTLGI
jgi:hypothetical protein